MEKKDECLILVDNSNVFIEGRKFSARKKGMPKTLTDQEPMDSSWRIDFGSLLKEVANGHKIIKAILVGSTPPPNDSLWNAAKMQGFEVKTYPRSRFGEEKAVDTELVLSGIDAIYEHPRPAILKLLSGDRDFIPLIARADKKGWDIELWGFSSSISYELALTVTREKHLDDVFDRIGRYED
ncbi:NYN domain protein [Bacteroidales bacterium Barb6XT]|nr:NYN domain protein [Bacteroidales bacterium Barb6XT]